MHGSLRNEISGLIYEAIANQRFSPLNVLNAVQYQVRLQATSSPAHYLWLGLDPQVLMQRITDAIINQQGTT